MESTTIVDPSDGFSVTNEMHVFLSFTCSKEALQILKQNRLNPANSCKSY